MKAILLAAGKATRLAPLSNHIPKCLLPINGKPLLAYWIDSLLKAGVKEILINTHTHAQMVTEWIESSIDKPYITIDHEEKLLGTAGTLLKHHQWINNQTVLLIHADNLAQPNLKKLIDDHKKKESKAIITMMTFTTDHPQSCGVVSLDQYNIVQEFFEKVANPPSSMANAAIYCIDPQLIQQLIKSETAITDFSTQVIPNFLGKIQASHTSTYLKDIGTIDRYLQANSEFKQTHPLPSCNAWAKIVEKYGITEKIKEGLQKWSESITEDTQNNKRNHMNLKIINVIERENNRQALQNKLIN